MTQETQLEIAITQQRPRCDFETRGAKNKTVSKYHLDDQVTILLWHVPQEIKLTGSPEPANIKGQIISEQKCCVLNFPKMQ